MVSIFFYSVLSFFVLFCGHLLQKKFLQVYFSLFGDEVFLFALFRGRISSMSCVGERDFFFCVKRVALFYEVVYHVGRSFS